MREKQHTEKIRKFNRFYANLLGKIDQEIYQFPYPLTETRVLSEIYEHQGATATEIREQLGIDRGQLSRIIQKFEDEEVVFRQQSAHDKRQFSLKLTPHGQSVHKILVHNANKGICKLIEPIDEQAITPLVAAMETIEQILQRESKQLPIIKIRKFGPGDIGYIAYLHGTLYAKNYQFNKQFEYDVLKGLAEFALDSTGGELWIAEVDGEIAGSIAITKFNDRTAQLRWFILDERYQGLGIGKQLMDIAIEFCQEQNYQHIFLWTVNILKTARYLYKIYGFEQTEEKTNNDWTPYNASEERWDLNLAAKQMYA